jgi:hypothetical protein
VPTAAHVQQYLATMFAEDLAKERGLRLAWHGGEMPVILGEMEYELLEEAEEDEVDDEGSDADDLALRPTTARAMPEMVVPELLKLPPEQELPPPLPSPGTGPVTLPEFQPTATPPSHFELATVPVYKRTEIGAEVTNTRRWRRYPVHIKVNGRYWQDGRQGEPISATICTLSEGGAMLRCDAPLRANGRVEFAVPVGLFSRVHVQGDVRWWSRAGAEREIGLEFIESKPELGKFLERRAP